MASQIRSDVHWVITLFLLGALGVLVLMNPKGFATFGGTIFGGFKKMGGTLTGSGYKRAS